MPPRPLVLVSGKDVVHGVGGHETYVRAHARAALRLGFEPHVYCVGRQARTTATEYGVVHHVAPQLPVAAQGPLLARAVVRQLAKLPGPHVIHGFAIWSTAAVLAARRLTARGSSAVAVASAYATRAYELAAMQAGLHDHLTAVERLRYRAWLRWVRAADDRVEGWGYAHAGVFLANYESVARIVSDSYGAAVRPRLVPYTTEAALMNGALPRPPRPASGHEPLVLAVSRHDPRKGLDVLLEALAAIDVPFRARLVGPGRLLAADRRLAAALGLSDRVEVVGRVEDVEAELAAADVYVLPSLAETSGSVSVIEALRAGIPVVASACDGLVEDLTHGDDSYLVAPGDPAALAAALRPLLLDPELRARLGAAGRATFERRFSPEAFVAALGEVYTDASP